MLLPLLLNFIYRTYRRASFPCNNPFPSLGVNSGSRGERFKFIRPRRRRKSWGTIDYEASRDFASNRGRAVEIKTSLAYRNWLETIAGNRDVPCVRLLNGRVLLYPSIEKKYSDSLNGERSHVGSNSLYTLAWFFTCRIEYLQSFFRYYTNTQTCLLAVYGISHPRTLF